MIKQSYIIAGTNTNIGKSFATKALKRFLTNSFVKSHCVKTAKIIQTGNDCDLDIHASNKEDQLNYVSLNFPAAAHFASAQENYQFDINDLETTVATWIKDNQDKLLIELSGGLYMPIVSRIENNSYLEYNQFDLIEYLCKQDSSIHFNLVTDLELGCLTATQTSLLAIDKLINSKCLMINLHSKQDDNQVLSSLKLDNIEQLMIIAGKQQCRVQIFYSESNSQTENKIIEEQINQFLQKSRILKVIKFDLSNLQHLR